MLSNFLAHNSFQRFTDQRRTFGNSNAGRLKGRDFIRGSSFSAGNNGPGMAHSPARWRGASGDKSDDRFLHVS